jgi:plasmid stabilization system protein ParE
MDIIWSDRAKKSYLKIRQDICERFTEKEEAKFVEQVFETINSIQEFPKAFPKSERKKLKSTRKAVIHPHSSLFYRIENKSRVRLLLFWDNRRNPSSIK